MRRLFLLAVLIAVLLPSQSWAGIAISVTSTKVRDASIGGVGTLAMDAVNVPSGALLVVCVKQNISPGTSTLTGVAGTGGDTFTLLTNQAHSGNNPIGRCAYMLAATANASYVATLTFDSTTGVYTRAVLYVFTYTGTASFDVEVGSTEDTNDQTPSSNSLTTASYDASNDGVCVAIHADNTAQTLSNELINGSAATATFIGTDASVFYRILTAGFTGISTITRTSFANKNWVQRVSCFKTTAGGGAATPKNLLMMGMGS